jgi:hypothetical protein
MRMRVVVPFYQKIYYTSSAPEEGKMAALLVEEGRFPAVQEISEAEYNRFVDICKNPPEPTSKLKDLLTSPRARKNWRSI